MLETKFEEIVPNSVINIQKRKYSAIFRKYSKSKIFRKFLFFVNTLAFFSYKYKICTYISTIFRLIKIYIVEKSYFSPKYFLNTYPPCAPYLICEYICVRCVVWFAYVS